MGRRYKCPTCGRVYDEPPGNDFLCERTKCAKKGKKLEPFEQAADQTVPFERGFVREAPEATGKHPALIEGLCVLICDGSNSMEERAFAKDPTDDRTRLRLVAEAIQAAIAEMIGSMSRIDTAYIAIIAYGAHAKLLTDREGHPFIKSVKDIADEFGGSSEFKKTQSFADWLHNQMQTNQPNFNREGTNITGALLLARGIVDATLKRDLSAFGVSVEVSPINQKPFRTPDERMVKVPNVRAMIYSDGEHNQGTLTNAFADMQPVSVLMTAFIGNDKDEKGNTRSGAEEMRKLATICPSHRQEGYFLINNAQRGEFLREIFHMATGRSGLCMQCMAAE